MTASEIIMVIAVFTGPIAAVCIGLWLEHRREVRQRKLETFRMLMRSRSLRLSGEHVAALNLIELEFGTDRAVMDAWRRYMQHLNPGETPFPEDPAGRLAFHEEQLNRLARLLYQIGKSLGFKHIEQLDIRQGNYAPRAWATDEEQQRLLRGLFIQLLTNDRALSIVPHNPNPDAGTYPPRPVPNRSEDTA